MDTHEIKPPRDTPWGRSDHTEKIADGIFTVGTPSHGGIWISKERRAQLPAVLRDYKDKETGHYWYEEDCEWCIIAIAFPEHFPKAAQDAATSTMRNWLPALYEKFYNVTLKPGESLINDDRIFQEANKQNYIVISAFGSWNAGVPKGMVGVFAGRGGRTARGGFPADQGYWLVPETEYQARGATGFVIDEARHEKVQKL